MSVAGTRQHLALLLLAAACGGPSADHPAALVPPDLAAALPTAQGEPPPEGLPQLRVSQRGVWLDSALVVELERHAGQVRIPERKRKGLSITDLERLLTQRVPAVESLQLRMDAELPTSLLRRVLVTCQESGVERFFLTARPAADQPLAVIEVGLDAAGQLAPGATPLVLSLTQAGYQLAGAEDMGCGAERSCALPCLGPQGQARCHYDQDGLRALLAQAERELSGAQELIVAPASGGRYGELVAALDAARSDDGTAALFARPLLAPVLLLQDEKRHLEPELVLDMLALRPGDVVADIGCGTGHFAFRLARQVGPAGQVMALDIQESAVTLLRNRALRPELNPHGNVRAWVNRPDDSLIPPDSLDLAFIAHMSWYTEESLSPENQSMLRSCFRAVKPGGRLAVLEFIPRPGGARKVTQHFETLGFEELQQRSFEDQRTSFFVFRKPG